MTQIDLGTTRNLRDLGGFPAINGGQTSALRLFRAELLTADNPNESNAEWRESDRDAYASLGLKTVIDLRCDVELEESPTKWPDATSATLISIPIEDGAPGTSTDLLAPYLNDASTEPFTIDSMVRYYITAFEGHGDDFVRGIDALADDATLPALIHCSAGKDRTGMLVALILSILGVDREAIIEDYAQTGRNRPNRVDYYRERFLALGVEPDDVRVMFESPAEVMRGALRALDATYGSPVDYLRHNGLGESTIETTRRLLLDPPT